MRTFLANLHTAAQRLLARIGRLLRGPLPLGAVAVVGAVAAVVALPLEPATRGDVGPGEVSVRAKVAAPRTELQLPPLGTISAATHLAPVAVIARVEQIDIDKVQALLVADAPLETLEDAVIADMAPLVRRFVIRTLLAALAVGALTGMVLPHRRWSFPLVGAGGGVAVIGALLASSWLTFDDQAFSQPRFEGPIDRAPALLATAQRHVEGIDDVRARLGALGDSVADLYAATAGERGPRLPDETRILHISDIHSNPAGLEIARRLAVGFDVHAVLDTGDLTSFGLPVEARMGALVADIPAVYLFVPGNHDSDQNRQALAEAGNVQVLDESVAEVNGLSILGVADPSFTADNIMTTEEANALKLAQAPSVAELVAEHEPDVLALHDLRLADAIEGEVPLVVAGHTHRRSVRRSGETLMLTVGSTGATGVESFMVRTDQAYEAQVLTFSGSELAAVDYVSLRGLGGNFRVERILVAGAAARSAVGLPTMPEPTPAPTPAP